MTPLEELQHAATTLQELIHEHAHDIRRLRLIEQLNNGTVVTTYLLGPHDENVAAHVVGLFVKTTDGEGTGFNVPDWADAPDHDI